jgi:hypothetical protein
MPTATAPSAGGAANEAATRAASSAFLINSDASFDFRIKLWCVAAIPDR